MAQQPIDPVQGGTGVKNNNASTITLSGSFPLTLTLTGSANITLPTSGTLVTTTSAVTSITGTTNQIAASASTGAITLSMPQNVIIPTPTSGVPLTLTSPSGAINGIVVNDGSTSTQTGSGLQIIRAAGSSANTISTGPNVYLLDSAVTTGTVLQHSGGQTELWQYNGSWQQILKVASTRGVTINAPSSGPTLTVNSQTMSGANDRSVLIQGTSTDTRLAITTTTSGNAQINLDTFGVQNWVLGNVRSDGSFRITASQTLGANDKLIIASAGNVTIPAPSSGTALTVTGVGNVVTSELTSNEGRLRLTATAASGKSYEWVSGGGNVLVAGTFGLFDVSRSAIPFAVSTNGNVTINAPSSGTAFAVNNVGASTAAQINSSASTNPTYIAYSQVVVNKAFIGVDGGNTLASGSANGDLVIRSDSSGTIRLSANAGATTQIGIAAAGNVTIAAPTSGNTLLINEVVGGDGLVVLAGSGSSTDRCLNLVWNGHYNLLNVYNDGHFFFGGSGGATLSGSATGNITIAAPSSGVALTVNGGNNGGVGIDSTTSQTYLQFSQSGTVVGYAGVALATSSLVNDSATGDMVLRTVNKAFRVTTNSGASTAFVINSAGNATFAAPSSGVPLTILSGGQFSTSVSARAAGNSLEFGHPNSVGYGSSIGAHVGNGAPFLAFNAEDGTSANTFKTRGIVGRVFLADLSGGFSTGRIVTASADNQAPTVDLTINSAGNITIAAPTSGIALAINGTGNILTISDGTSTSALQSSAGTHYFGTLTNTPFALMTNNVTRMTITAAGAASFINSLSAGSWLGSIGRASTISGWLDGNYGGVGETGTTAGCIYSLGSNTYIPAAGTTNPLNTMYGIGYTTSSTISGPTGTQTISARTGAPISNWGMYVASNGIANIFLDSDSGGGYFTGPVAASSFSGSGAGLTGTAGSLNIGGNAATATTATTATTVINNSGRTDGTAYPVLWAPAGGGAGEPTYSCAAVTIQSSTGTLTATVLNATSDRNLKTNITPINNASKIIDSLTGVRFDWKNNGIASAGLIAQDVEVLMPELVTTSELGDKSLNYNGIVGALVEAMKEMNATIASLKTEIEALKVK